MGWSCDHVHLKASNLNETVDFYQKNFGAVQENTREVGGSKLVGLDIGGLKVLVSSKKPDEDPIPGSAEMQYGLIHFGLLCDNLEQELATLKGNGVEVTMELTEIWPGLKIAYIKAPDETLIELLQRD